MTSATHPHHNHGEGCSCCSSGLQAAMAAAERMGVSRRNLLMGAGSLAVAAWASAPRAAQAQGAQPAEPPKFTPARELVVQPVLAYATPQRQPETSWRSWGGIQTEDDANREVNRIQDELGGMISSSKLSLKLLPIAKVRTMDEAGKARESQCDVMLIYAAGGHRGLLENLVRPDRPSVFFLRHRSGPVSLHYEILHPHFLRKATDEYKQPGVDIEDVVVDEYDDLAWRMRALLALRKTLGQRIVALGGPMGWGAGHQLAPPIARDKWHLDIRTVTYEDFGERTRKALADTGLVNDARKQAKDYLAQPGVTLHTDKAYVENAMVVYRLFKELMAEHDATAFTIGGCMTTVIPMTKTTACLPLTLINDEGYLAFCESDFVVIPSGILMHHILGTPVFLNDPTWPHHGVVTLAHCTAPRRMNGKDDEPMQVHTHFESDYGAAPKVDMKIGQVVTNIVPDFECRKWVGALGRIEANPFHDICRSQIDVAIEGDCDRLLADMRGFHWMTAYGDCLKEVGYAIKHLDIEWENVSA